ncbi:MAG: class I SAM-dependent methyltransferase [Croceibacterium sp.]
MNVLSQASSAVTAPPSGAAVKLDLGCGAVKSPGYVGMDVFAAPGVDVVASFDDFPYPFADNTFDEIKCYNSLEHVGDFVRTVTELHRILKPGGILKVLCPHYSGPDAYRDPTHKTFFAYTTFNMFTEGLSYGTPWAGLFRVRKRMFGMPDGGGRGLAAIPKAFGNRFPDLYERYLCWMMPAKAIYYELEAVKPDVAS